MTTAAVLTLPDRTPDAIAGGNIKYLIGDRGIEQGDLARRLEMDPSTLSLKIAGKRKWTIGELVKVSDIFGVSVDSIVRRRDFAPVGGGTRLYGVGTSIHRSITGAESRTSDYRYDESPAEVISLSQHRRTRDTATASA